MMPFTQTRVFVVALAAAGVAACSKGGDSVPAARDTTATVAIAPAAPKTFAWFAGQSLLELRDSVTLAQWVTNHRNDALPLERGEWCAKAVESVALPMGYTASRTAFFYEPLPAESVVVPDEHPDIEHACMLGMIVVTMQADTSEDSLLVSARREIRRLFGSASDTRVFGADRPPVDEFEGADIPGDSLVVFAKLPRSDDARVIALDIGAYPRPERDDTTFVSPYLEMNEGCDKDLDSLIRAGERLLPSVTDSRLVMTMHYMIADAYADRVMATDDPDDRVASISHYRAALAMEHRHPTAHAGRSMWVLWRLLAGLKPGGFVYGRDCGD
jgi:hypothetical protein